MTADAWMVADPIGCPICGREACEDHLVDEPKSERNLAVEREYERERARREARRRLDAEARAGEPVPEILTLRERLARPRSAMAWRIEQWQPAATRVMLAAQFKAGKTTLRDNVTRSYVDGDPFLGRYQATPIDGNLAIIDTEMSATQLEDWLRDQRIRNDDRVILVPLRGAVGTFNLIDPVVRSEWVARVRSRNVRALFFDCLRPVFDVLGLDEHNQAGRFLVAFDAFLAEAGITDAIVVHHMGHTNERARGDSRLRDWPDVEWRLVRQDDDPASPRFISAYGRDVDVPESQLAYDGSTRRLTLAGGSRRDATARAALDDVRAVLRTEAPLSGRALKAKFSESEHGRDVIEAAIKLGLREGALTFSAGPRHSKLYRLSECPGVSDECPTDSTSECPAAYREPDTGHSLLDAVSVRDGAL